MNDTAIRFAYADVGALQIHHAECGPRDAPPVLLLHQSPRSWAEYREVLPLLGRTRRAIAMDTAGFGASTPLPDDEAGIEAWARVAWGLLDALGIGEAALVGHHTGAAIALEMAAAQPSRASRVVLSSGSYTDEAFRRARASRPAIDEVAMSEDGSHLRELWQRRAGFYPRGRPDLLQAFVLDALKVFDRVEQGHRAVGSYRMEERIGRLTMPVLVIRAAADPHAAPHAHQLLARLPRATLVEIEDGMVPLPDQMPERFAQVVLRFLDGAAG